MTIDLGTNHLVNPRDNLLLTFKSICSGNIKRPQIIPLWDGKSSIRISKVIKIISINYDFHYHHNNSWIYLFPRVIPRFFYLKL